MKITPKKEAIGDSRKINRDSNRKKYLKRENPIKMGQRIKLENKSIIGGKRGCYDLREMGYSLSRP